MVSEFIKKLMQEPTEEEKQVSDILKSICFNEYQSQLDTIVALQYFRGIEDSLIIGKVSAVNTPLIRQAMQYEH